MTIVWTILRFVLWLVFPPSVPLSRGNYFQFLGASTILLVFLGLSLAINHELNQAEHTLYQLGGFADLLQMAGDTKWDVRSQIGTALAVFWWGMGLLR